MASYHCTVKVGGKGKAGAHAEYISREGKYSGKARYEDLEATAHGNMPQWAAHNPAHFWSAADEYERANGATYREIEVALPRELTPEQRRALVEDFIAKEVGDKHAYQWAIHTPKAALEKSEQPHAHIMYSERTVDGIDRDPEQYFKRYNAKNPEKGGCRKDSAGTDERLQATRQHWANVQNAHLERHGIEARVDHRSLKQQGIDRQPEKHIGASRVMDMPEHDVAALLARRAAEGELERAQQGVSLIDVAGDLKAAIAERDRQLNLKQEQENEQRIDKAGRTISRSFGFSESDFASIAENLRAAESINDLNGIALASVVEGRINRTERIRENLRTADRSGQVTIEDARGFNRAGRTVEEAARGQHARRAGGIVSAIGAQLERAIPQIARTITRVEIYTLERDQAQQAQAAQAVAKVQADALAQQQAAQERARAAVVKGKTEREAAVELKNKQQEVERERIRSTAFDRIGTACRAAGSNIGNAGPNVEAAGKHLAAATSLANGAGRDPIGVAKATIEHKHEQHLEGVADALVERLERAFPEIARAIGQAAQRAVDLAHQPAPSLPQKPQSASAPDPYRGMNNTERILAERAAQRVMERTPPPQVAPAARPLLTTAEAEAALELAQRKDYNISGNTRLDLIREAKRALREAVAAERSNPNPSGAAGPLPLPAEPEPSLLDRLAASWAVMVAWIKGQGSLATMVDVDTDRSTHEGSIVEIDELHAIQKIGRTTFAIHRLDALDKTPPVGEPGTKIDYRAGRGIVTRGPDRGDRPSGRGGR